MWYKHRGIVAAFLGVLLLFFPPANFEPIGIPLFAIAVFLRIWARMHIGEHSRGYNVACPEIVKTGPYKYVNHPLYISNFMAGAAFALFYTGFSFVTLGFCSVYGGFLAILAINENKFLKQSQKPLPHLNNTSRISIKQSIASDFPTWFWQIAMLVFIFLRKWHGFCILIKYET